MCQLLICKVLMLLKNYHKKYAQSYLHIIMMFQKRLPPLFWFTKMNFSCYWPFKPFSPFFHPLTHTYKTKHIHPNFIHQNAKKIALSTILLSRSNPYTIYNINVYKKGALKCLCFIKLQESKCFFSDQIKKNICLFYRFHTYINFHFHY